MVETAGLPLRCERIPIWRLREGEAPAERIGDKLSIQNGSAGALPSPFFTNVLT